MHIFFDIETVPLVSDAIVAEVSASITPPRTMSKPETIAKWEADEKPALVEAELAKGGLDASRGRVICFTFATNDAKPVAIMGDELSILELALEAMNVPKGQIPVFVGHNIAGFDLPFIRQRCWANGLRVPRKPFKVKAWDDCIEDTMLMWSAERDRRISLDRLCRVLGVPSPKADGFDGSMVWGAYKAGDLGRIEQYAIADVNAVRNCWERMQ